MINQNVKDYLLSFMNYWLICLEVSKAKNNDKEKVNLHKSRSRLVDLALLEYLSMALRYFKDKKMIKERYLQYQSQFFLHSGD